MAVGQAEGVGRRAVAGDLAVDGGSPGLGVLQLLQDEHAAALAEDEAVAVAVERPARPRGVVVAGRHRRQEDEPGEAERVDHAVGAAGEHHVGVAAADQLGRLADRLGAGGARRLAGRVRPPGAEDGRQVPDRSPGLLLGFAGRVEGPQPEAREPGRVDAALAGRAVDQVDEAVEVLLSLARAEVDPEAGAIRRCVVEPRVRHGHASPRPGRIATSGCARANGRRRAGSRPGGNRATSAAIRVAKVAASKSVIGPTPPRPSHSARQDDSASRPTGVIIPMPVTTTRRRTVCLLTHRIQPSSAGLYYGSNLKSTPRSAAADLGDIALNRKDVCWLSVAGSEVGTGSSEDRGARPRFASKSSEAARNITGCEPAPCRCRGSR